MDAHESEVFYWMNMLIFWARYMTAHNIKFIPIQ